MDTRDLTPLVSALDGRCQYGSHEMMRFFLSGLFSLWGLPEYEPIPDSAVARIQEAIGAYSAIVDRQPAFTDVLGPLYMELASRGSRSHMGQFFTPMNIAHAMAAMTVGEQPPDDGRLISAVDPACGSGVMMLAFASQVLEQWGEAGLLRVSITGVDLDPICARLMAAQFIANCAAHDLYIGEFVVLCGNSLCPNKDMELIVHATAPNSSAAVTPALHPARLAAVASAAASQPDLRQQLGLFDAA